MWGEPHLLTCALPPTVKCNKCVGPTCSEFNKENENETICHTTDKTQPSCWVSSRPCPRLWRSLQEQRKKHGVVLTSQAPWFCSQVPGFSPVRSNDAAWPGLAESAFYNSASSGCVVGSVCFFHKQTNVLLNVERVFSQVHWLKDETSTVVNQERGCAETQNKACTLDVQAEECEFNTTYRVSDTT